MTFGTIKHFRSEKGYGSILDDTGFDHFFHVSSLIDKFRGAPVPWQRVSFKISQNSRTMKIQAVGVELLEPILEPRPSADAIEMSGVAFMGRNE